MASMGDDQEENIEMWKIKKVYAHTYIYILFFLTFSFTRKCFRISFLSFVFLFARRRDDDERESPEERKR